MLTRVTLELRVFEHKRSLPTSSRLADHTGSRTLTYNSTTRLAKQTPSHRHWQNLKNKEYNEFTKLVLLLSWNVFLGSWYCFCVSRNLFCTRGKAERSVQREAWRSESNTTDRHRAPKKLALRNSGFERSSLPTNHPQVSRVSLCFCRQTVSSNSQLLTVSLFVWQLDYKLLAESNRRKVRELPGQGTLLVGCFQFRKQTTFEYVDYRVTRVLAETDSVELCHSLQRRTRGSRVVWRDFEVSDRQTEFSKNATKVQNLRSRAINMSTFRPEGEVKCKKGPQKRVFQRILRRLMSC